MKKILHFLTSRSFFCGLSIVVQLALIVLATLYLGRYNLALYAVYIIGSILVILYIVSDDENPIYKLAWIIPIALFPLLGWLIYFLLGRNRNSPQKKAFFSQVNQRSEQIALQDESVLTELREKDPAVFRQVSYLHNITHLPVCKNTQSLYLSPGERFFEQLCEELEKAENFIFMEYFSLQEGTMWNTIRDILIRKAREGVEIKFLFDGFGCLLTLPDGYVKELRKWGIDAYVFNPFRPSPDTFMNHRDHRKITVIDGNVGFIGGINLADEYINAYEKHGHWKDSSLMLKGEGVWNLSLLFLDMWMVLSKQKISDFDRYRPTKEYPSDGYVISYGDSPLDKELVGEICYMNMIQNARESVTITTPYLILDNEMRTTLCAAAKSGIRVQIVTPGIADKWYVHAVTRYNYRPLIEAGVEIYEYTGGFIHAKTVVADNQCAVVGTQNFDFRSFYLHFECATYLYGASAVNAVTEDHQAVIARSHRVTSEEYRKQNWFTRVVQVCLNLFAPLM